MPRPDMSAQRVPQILLAATRVFARSGLASARMEDIAAEAGISKATIYLYFKKREDLVAALLQEFLQTSLDELQDMSEKAGEVTGLLIDWSHKATTRLTETAAFANLGLEFMALAARDPLTKTALAGYYRGYVEAISALIERGIRQGEFRQQAPERASKNLIAAMEGMHLLWLVGEGDIDLVADTRSVLESFLASVARS